MDRAEVLSSHIVPLPAMFSTSALVPLAQRTVGVVERDDALTQPGYNLFSKGRESYLIDADGRVVHEWRSEREVFCAILRDNGNLLRDGSENVLAVAFRAGGAAGFVEEVTWDNAPVWQYAPLPMDTYLTHHALEPMPSGGCLVMCWQRRSKEECLRAGRRPDLIPDGEVWDNLITEIRPDGKGSVEEVWQWSIWDHLVQDYDPARSNYGNPREHPELIDVNFCPPGGKSQSRNTAKDTPDSGRENPQQFAVQGTGKISGSGRGEKDWLHANSVSYDPVRDQVLVSLCTMSEIVVVDHSTTKDEVKGHTGGKQGKGGDVLFRYGNPQAYRRGTRLEQQLFCPHSASFLRGVPGEGRVLVFNNGRAVDRHWSTVDEYELPESAPGSYVIGERKAFGPPAPAWRYGPPAGRRGSFYCTHISAAQRLPNGNTLVVMGPQGVVSEVTPSGAEAWRYVCPAAGMDGNPGVVFVRQGDQRLPPLRFSLSQFRRYAPDSPAFAGRELTPGRYLEA